LFLLSVTILKIATGIHRPRRLSRLSHPEATSFLYILISLFSIPLYLLRLIQKVLFNFWYTNLCSSFLSGHEIILPFLNDNIKNWIINFNLILLHTHQKQQPKTTLLYFFKLQTVLQYTYLKSEIINFLQVKFAITNKRMNLFVQNCIFTKK